MIDLGAILLVLAAAVRSPQDAALSAAAPKKQEPRPPDLLQEPRLHQEEKPSWLDFDWLEIEPRVGMALFSEDYHIDPSAFLSVRLHAPLTCLSPDSNPGGEYFGLFAEFAFFPSVERDLNPEPADPSGSILGVNLGLDYTLVRNQSCYWVLQGGAQYGSYGGISDLNDGIAPTAGLAFGINLGKSLILTLGNSTVFAHAGDKIYMNSLGLLIEF
jgi:hypothetical protein